MTDAAANGPSPSAEFGLVLRSARENAGMAKDQVADALHLDVAVVSAIEEGRFADLPMRPYARGYVRNYARVLGLDGDELARRFDAADADRPEPSAAVPRHRVTLKSELALRPLALGYAAIVAVLLIALGAVLWAAWRVQDWRFPFLADDPVGPPTVEQMPDSPTSPPNVSPWPTVADGRAADGATDEGGTAASAAEEPVARTVPVADDRTEAVRVQAEPLARTVADSAPAQEPSLAPARVADAAPAPVDGPADMSGVVGELTLVFDGESWVSVDDATGRRLFGDLGRDASFTVKGPVPLSVLVGNAPAVRLEFDGESVDLGPFTTENNVARLEIGGG